MEGSTLTGANNDASVLLYVNFFAWVPEAQPAARDRRYHVAFVVDPSEMGDLGVKVRRPGRVSNPRRPECDASDRGSLWEVKPHEERIKFRERSAERVTDLHKIDKVGMASRGVTKLTRMTSVERCSAIKRFTSARI